MERLIAAGCCRRFTPAPDFGDVSADDTLSGAAVTIVGKLCGLVLLFALQPLWVASLHAQSPDSLGLLRLAGGDHVPGTLADVKVDDAPTRRIGWSHPGFASPLQFDLSSVIGASFPKPKNAGLAPGMHAVEFENGDRLFGDVGEADDWAVRVRTADFGEITVLRSAIKRISRWDGGASMVFVGPGPIEQWKLSGGAGAWQSGGGQLRTQQDGAAAFRNIGLPNHSNITAELSWDGDPNFVLAIGVDAKAIGVDAKNEEQSASTAFRIEVWEGEVVVYRELDTVGNVFSLGKTSELEGTLRLNLELHQTDGRIIARSPQGETLGNFTLPTNSTRPANKDPADRDPNVQPGVRLTNIKGNVSLDSLAVTRARAVPDRQSADDPATLHLTDGSVRSGRWTGTHEGQWAFLEGSSAMLIEAEQIVALELGNSASPASEQATTEQILSHGGIRLAGTVQSLDSGRLHLHHAAIIETVSFANDQIARIAVEGAERARMTDSDFILGRLVFPGGQLTGQLIDTQDQNEPTPLRFSLRGANTVQLHPGFTGRMVYRESPPPETAKQRRVREQREAAERRVAQQRQNQGGVLNVLARAFGNNKATERGLPPARAMHLRSGEVIPCEVEMIDEQEVVFKSELTGQTRLPADQVRAIAFAAGCRDPEVEATRRDRLLTVPRVRKKNRPTHLIIAKNDDILRCRLVKLDQDAALVETRLEQITIDRALIAQIIWLKEDAHGPDEDQENDDPEPARDFAVRALLRNGNRMSMIVTSIQDSIVIGEHPLLGESRIKLGDVNELLLGINIDQADEGQPYNGWTLKDAPEPIIPDPGGGGASGMSSLLVGKDAPDFTLDLLDGGRFNVADQRGKVIVLDFWATWCGPCLQAMPVIEKTVQQFDDDDVRLVAVNLQETADPIRGTLERLNVSPEVALDIDGVAAARYQADAIPQTVVIGRDGKIMRLFVGGGPQLADNLQQAIQEAIQAGAEE